MTTDFHVFLSYDDEACTVKREGAADDETFVSLSEALLALRRGNTGFVVIHDADGRSANRIPLQF